MARTGRPKGSPNRATADVRAAIATFAEANVEKMGEWLNAVAEGDATPVFDEKGRERARREPDPGKALDLYLKAIEYHIPKLGRTVIAGDPNAPVPVFQWAKPSK